MKPAPLPALTSLLVLVLVLVLVLLFPPPAHLREEGKNFVYPVPQARACARRPAGGPGAGVSFFVHSQEKTMQTTDFVATIFDGKGNPNKVTARLKKYAALVPSATSTSMFAPPPASAAQPPR